mmetsp:Transcript_75401/g.180103  ORF Transcript_75401/g.180103 Transcript_75401/m.180103 type:complete len:832 (+) Transcript_75401:48-2543(+)
MLSRLAVVLAVASPLLSRAARVAADKHDKKVEEDPFGDMLPPMGGNPVVWSASHGPPSTVSGVAETPAVVMEEERILASESLVDEQVELNQEERMEVECVGMEHLREVTDYQREQTEAEIEMRNIRAFTPTEAEHKCMPLHLRNKKLPGRLFSDRVRYANCPPFPERLGEIVVEAVHHTENAGKQQHVVLELVGCTSCENDQTGDVEWGGLLGIDETGNYRDMYRRSRTITDNFGSAHAGLEGRVPIVETPMNPRGYISYPRTFSTEQTPRADQKYVKIYKYKYSSFKFDASILNEVVTMAGEAAGNHSTVDGAFVHAHEAEELKILKELREQEKRIPFNHKLEQIHMHIYVCDESGRGLACPAQPTETLLVHDAALAFDSSKTSTFDELGKHSGMCTYGPCMTHAGMQMGKENHVMTWTMCTGCTEARCGSASRASPRSSDPAPSGEFNCLVERAYTSTGHVDLMSRKPGTGGTEGSGFLFRGAEAKGHVTGHINWHLSVPRAGHCEPFLQDVAYVGIGVDECDKCPNGEVDVDIGMVLLNCPDGNTKGLGGAIPSQCKYVDHQNFAHKTSGSSNYAISEDDRSGEGEGDDEWAYLNLAKLRQTGVSHVLIVANIYGCAKNHPPSSEIGWQDLEGAFMRVTGSSAHSKSFENAETIGYVDLDGMQGPAQNGAGLVMFYLAKDETLAAPSAITRTDSAGGTGKHWKMAVVKKSYQGAVLSSGRALEAFGIGTVRNVENGVAEAAADMSLPNALATNQTAPAEHATVVELGPVVTDATSESNEVHFSGESSGERKAKEMTNQELWNNLAATLPEGPPGTDAFCVPGIASDLM